MPFSVATGAWEGRVEPTEEDDSTLVESSARLWKLGYDGVLGMGLRDLNTLRRDKQATFLDHVIEQNSQMPNEEDQGVFAAYFGTEMTQEGRGPFVRFGGSRNFTETSEDLGEYDKQRNAMQFSYAQLVSTQAPSSKLAGFWVVEVTSFRIVPQDAANFTALPLNPREQISILNETIGSSHPSVVEKPAGINICEPSNQSPEVCVGMVDSGSSFLGLPNGKRYQV